MEDEKLLHEKQNTAKRVYVEEGLSIKRSCFEAGVDEAQMRQWIRGGDWDALKRTQLTSKGHQLKQLYDLLEKVNDKMAEADEINPRDVDLAVKYTAAIKNLDVELTIPDIVEIAKMFTSWLRRQDKELAKTIARHFDAFIKQRLKPYSTL
jgi:hypothetical protein